LTGAFLLRRSIALPQGRDYYSKRVRDVV
jgi:hypothetical protein